MTIANENPTLTGSGKAGLTRDESYCYSLALTMPKGLLFVKAILIDRCAMGGTLAILDLRLQIGELRNSGLTI